MMTPRAFTSEQNERAGSLAVFLLRGINVGGRNKLAMVDLRAVAVDVGIEDPLTYIQSGNLIGDIHEDAAVIAGRLTDAIKQSTELIVPVVARTAAEWRRVIDVNPFPEIDDPTKLHVTFFTGEPSAKLSGLDPDDFVPERFGVIGRDLYLSLPGGMGRSKLAAATVRADGTGTGRNWKTVLHLAAMISDRQSP